MFKSLIVIFGNLKSIVSNIDTLKFISFKDIKQSKENFLQNDKMTIYFEVCLNAK